MNPIPTPEPRKTPPCKHHCLRATRRAAAGLTRLEFAVAVIVAGVMASFALERIAQLQHSAQDVRAETTAAQQRAVTAQAEALVPGSPAASAPTPRLLVPAQASQSQAVP
jgi:hypothetical protein